MKRPSIMLLGAMLTACAPVPEQAPPRIDVAAIDTGATAAMPSPDESALDESRHSNSDHVTG